MGRLVQHRVKRFPCGDETEECLPSSTTTGLFGGSHDYVEKGDFTFNVSGESVTLQYSENIPGLCEQALSCRP